MATYRITAYSTDVYGSRPLVALDASPVTATPIESGILQIAWAVPGGTWTELRLVKSAAGYPVTVDDGELLYSSAYPDGTYTDTQLAPNRWYYYSVFLLVGGSWLLAGQTSGLAVGDLGYGPWLYTRVPNAFKYEGSELSSLSSSRRNDILERFVSIFGWGLDIQWTYANTLLDLYNPRTTHEANVNRLARQFGMPIQVTMPGRLRRQAVENATYLHQKRGSVEGLRDLINAVTGLDADIRVSQNMMLSDDQAMFTHPDPPSWSEDLRYLINDLVTYNKKIFKCRVTGTSGAAKAPNADGTLNTWWQWVTNTWDATTALNPVTGGQYTWMVVKLSDNSMPNSGGLGLGVGLPTPTALTDYTTNALAVKNSTGVTGSYDARSVSRLAGYEAINFVEPIQNIKDGIPLPKVHKTWDAVSTFRPGDLVRYNGLVFQAQFEVVGGSAPGVTDPDHPTAWKNVGVDERYGITVSFYVHQSFVNGDGVVAVYPHVGFFDEHGNYFNTLYAPGTNTLAIDTFGFPGQTYPNPANPDVNGRQMERFSAYTWTTHTGAFVRDPYLGGVARPTVATTVSIATVNASANMKVALTPRTEPDAAKKWALIFRYSSISNYWSAEKNGLYKVVSGVKTLVGTYSTAISLDDRVVAEFNGSAIKVYRNGTQVLSITDAFNSSATRHGIGNL